MQTQVGRPAQQPTVWYRDETIEITSSHIIVFDYGGQQTMYAMQSVTSARIRKDEPSHFFPLMLIIVGALLLLGALSNLSITGGIGGLAIGGIGVLMWSSEKTAYQLLITTAAGEHQLFRSYDNLFIKELSDAIRRALGGRLPR